MQHVDVATATGCCVCRGVAGGEPRAVKSCTDGQLVQACLQKCRAENAGSLGFQYHQTCASGCAGFFTQD
jgi:hypothetical protein